MARKRSIVNASAGFGAGDSVSPDSVPSPFMAIDPKRKLTAGESAFNAALENIGYVGNAVDDIERAALTPIQQQLAVVRTNVAHIDNAITSPIIASIREASDIYSDIQDKVLMNVASGVSSAMEFAGAEIMDRIEGDVANTVPSYTSELGESTNDALQGETPTILSSVSLPQVPTVPNGFGSVSGVDGSGLGDSGTSDLESNFAGLVSAQSPLVGVTWSCTPFNANPWPILTQQNASLASTYVLCGQIPSVFGGTVYVITKSGCACPPSIAGHAALEAGTYLCVASNCGTATQQQPPVQPPVIPPGDGTPVLPVEPPEEPGEPPCLKICGFPPPDNGKPQECPPLDKCNECVGMLWFNKKTCQIKVFIEGCGPLRTELQDWVEIGSPVSADDLVARFREHKCIKPEPDKDRQIPPLPPGFEGAAGVQLCDVLTPAFAAATVDTPKDVFNDLGNAILEAVRSGVFGSDVVLRYLGRLLAIIFGGTGNALESTSGKWLQKVFGAVGCFDERLLNIWKASLAGGFIDRWIATVPDQIKLPFVHQAQFACPTGIPSPAEATAAYISGTINYETWRCWVRGGNQREQFYDRIRLAARTKLSVFELLRLRKRDAIDDQAVSDGIRALGYIQEDDASNLKLLAEQLPGPQDIVRFMLRDTADPNSVQRFGLDDEFDKKFDGILKDYADWQHVPTELMRHYWRAHWAIPAPTQLFEFFQRSRSKPELWPSGKPLEDLRAALIQQDILPKWHPLFIESTFRRPTRVDTRRQLELGVIEVDDAIEAWKEIGYSDINAERLANLADQGARVRALKHPAVKRAASGELTPAEMRDMMIDDGINEKYIADAQRRAVRENIAQRRKKCVAGYRKRFLAAEFGVPEAVGLLAGQGVLTSQAEQIVKGWECEMMARGKEVNASQLCKWFSEGMLSLGEFYARLVRVGYDESDASRIVQECQLKIDRQLAAAEKRRMLEAIRKAKAESAEQRRRQRELQSAADKAASGYRKQQLTNQQREKLLIDAAQKMSAKTGDDVRDAKRTVNNIYLFVQSNTGATPSQVARIVLESAESPTVDSYDTLESTAFGLVQSRVFAIPLEPAEIL